MTFLEIGCGDCAHAIMVAARAAHVYAVDVSDLIASHSD
jgi:methylase of polypeptide subunit release factors